MTHSSADTSENPNQLHQIKQELLDLRNQIMNSNQLNTIHKFNLNKKLKYMIIRTNHKITTELKWNNKIDQLSNQNTNESQQQLISYFFKPKTNISQQQYDITAKESIQRQTQAFNSND